MKYTVNRKTYVVPITNKTPCKVEGRMGKWTIIDAARVGNDICVLLEHNTYGDETAFLLAQLPRAEVQWIADHEDEWQEDRKGILRFEAKYELAETYDDIVTALIDEDLIDKASDCDVLSDEDLNYTWEI